MLLDKVLAKIFGSANERYLKRIRPLVSAINDREARLQALSDAELQAQTARFKERLDQGESLDDLLPDAFATVREASRRVTGMRHFDVQLIGGIALHHGRIAEMRTGEGKTLVATLPVYLNALTGRGVHVVTVNDYLAKRDAEWMGKIYRFLGLSVGVIQNHLYDDERRAAYACDITYGTNNEFGFDYLRDNMKYSVKSCVQRGHYFAIVDEVDSILIDEARTPLIIAGPSDESSEKYYLANDVIPKLNPATDYLVDEKTHTAALTESGIERVEKLLGVENLYDPANFELLHCVNQALKAHTLYHRDKEYMVRDGQVIIVDEHTGRPMDGRRWSDGLHQAVEAKEGVKIEAETQTLATITLQNYFRMYEKLAGMTGTAETEAAEFAKIYNLEVTVIPTHRPMIRQDYPDLIYRTAEEKWNAIVEEIKERHQTGQPILVGTASVANSELVSRKLSAIGIPHNVLNAKYHEREAEIVAQAGRKGMVTIATNMAGRGTDILLGGNPEFLTDAELRRQGRNPAEVPPEERQALFEQIKAQTDREHAEVVALGGLHIIGSERHESRRIDNQLRGRAGRQGDPGSSRFYLSLEDDLMRIFGGERLKNIMLTLGMEEGVAIESRMVSRRVEAAQKSVEAHNFSIRKHLLEYDDVMNLQRETIYNLRRELMEGAEGGRQFIHLAEDLLADVIRRYLHGRPEEWDVDGLRVALLDLYAYDCEAEKLDFEHLNREEIRAKVWQTVLERYRAREAKIGAENLRQLERHVMLNIVDAHWKKHLATLDHLKEGVGLRGYGQKDPLIEYKKESSRLFEEMIDRMDEECVRILFNMRIEVAEASALDFENELVAGDEAASDEFEVAGELAGEVPAPPTLPRRVAQRAPTASLPTSRPATGQVYTAANAGAARAGEGGTVVRRTPKIGRNEPCPCGSGKKYKNCHGA
ncbi:MULTISPECIES: preprotein translocase subunit SecA [Chloracidobacterium]|jgi:preprotein translocase subunit SecA|uniref:Protein translocase subunit SecA n=1 Tax=Chloracidobacterium thermophilum (strain B) TaxID=981222 RepID=G2LI78_CHLTF|nr:MULTISPECIES: preprotein translocase subunit SecA [Chloracidobacterium]AEP11536.1 protein translocase subunit secA [Chloracidobacterium thermophilum B]QUV79425.1 preprotein translocase subunit SecA [Chloracidobacterium thermophilum]QUV82462.1 preprotein translocase subunit SecA [Chloracidobacterium sp. D]